MYVGRHVFVCTYIYTLHTYMQKYVYAYMYIGRHACNGTEMRDMLTKTIQISLKFQTFFTNIFKEL